VPGLVWSLLIIDRLRTLAMIVHWTLSRVASR
jgi:hypothetical protein